MRWPGILARVVGWLLTPLVAWAASLWGAWLVFGLSGGVANPRRAIYLALGVAVVMGTTSLFLWMQLLKRSPRLRKSLHVTREGLPEIEEPAAEPPAPAPPAPAEGSDG
jgi:hypothetical protein